jgi:uncharacterized protein YbjT (DUF2867 family)
MKFPHLYKCYLKGEIKMILMIGASGNVGIPVIRHLIIKGEKIRAFVHSQKSVEIMKTLGVTETFVGDFRKDSDLCRAMEGCSSVFHVAPPFSDDEADIGYKVIKNARISGIEHIVFTSALHSQLSKMDHHAQKLLVEEAIILSKLKYLFTSFKHLWIFHN